MNSIFIILVANYILNRATIINTSKTTQIFTNSILGDLLYANKIRGLQCNLKIYQSFDVKESEFVLNLTQITEETEPYEINSLNITNLRVNYPTTKFRSVCWNIVFIISKASEPILSGHIIPVHV